MITLFKRTIVILIYLNKTVIETFRIYLKYLFETKIIESKQIQKIQFQLAFNIGKSMNNHVILFEERVEKANEKTTKRRKRINLLVTL